MQHTYEIKGAYYRPPAKGILSVLPAKTPLILRPDPYGGPCGTSHDDPNAISVHLATDQIPEKVHQALELAVANGLTLDVVLGFAEHHLGYVPKEVAAKLRLDHEVPASLSFTPKGSPSVTWADPEPKFPLPRQLDFD